MASIFSQPQNIQGGFRADQVSVSINGISTGILITSVGVNFEQPIQMIYALSNLAGGARAGGARAAGNQAAGANQGASQNGNNVYMVAGRPSGACQIETIIGPTAINTAWLTQFGDACRVTTNNMTFVSAAGNCSTPQGGGAATQTTNSTGQYTLAGCVITRYGLQVQSDQAIIRNSLEIRFADLQLPAPAAGANGAAT